MERTVRKKRQTRWSAKSGKGAMTGHQENSEPEQGGFSRFCGFRPPSLVLFFLAWAWQQAPWLHGCLGLASQILGARVQTQPDPGGADGA